MADSQAQTQPSKAIFSLFYYSHIHLVLMGMLMAAVNNYVLTNQVAWKAILLIGMSTYFTYSIDNLFDWKIDRQNYIGVEGMLRKYQRFSLLPITLCGVGIVWIVTTSNAVFTLSIGLLTAAVAFSITRLAFFRKSEHHQPVSVGQFILNRAFISLVWSLVCVFLPLIFSGHAIDKRAWSSLVYLWNLVCIYAVIWKLEKSPPYLQKLMNASSLKVFLQAMSLNAVLIPIVNRSIGQSGTLGLINTLPPLAFFMLLEKMNLDWRDARPHLLKIAIILAGVIVGITIIHLMSA